MTLEELCQYNKKIVGPLLENNAKVDSVFESYANDKDSSFNYPPDDD